MVSFKSIIVTSAALLAAFVTVEAAISPSYPEPGTIQTEGKAFDILWDYDGKDSSVTYQIDFMTGSNDNQTVLANVAKKVKGSALKYSYTAPAVTPNSAIYFFMFTGSDGSYYWTTRFGIIKPGGELAAEPEKKQPNGDAIPWGNGELVASNTTTTATALATTTTMDVSSSSIATAIPTAEDAASSVNINAVAVTSADNSQAASPIAQAITENIANSGSILKPALTFVVAGATAAYVAL